MDTLSPLAAMLLLDRSCVIVRIFLKLHATFPNNFRSRSMSDQIMEKTHLVPELDRVKEKCEKSLVNEMLDWIPKLTISDN